MSIYVRMRVTNETAEIAQGAAKTGELVEIKDRHGVLHKGWVRGVQYEVGLDQGWFIALELRDDTALMPVRPIDKEDNSLRNVIEQLNGPWGRSRS